MDGDCFVWLYFVDRFAGWEWLAGSSACRIVALAKGAAGADDWGQVV
jgi:hypothetical protein